MLFEKYLNIQIIQSSILIQSVESSNNYPIYLHCGMIVKFIETINLCNKVIQREIQDVSKQCRIKDGLIQKMLYEQIQYIWQCIQNKVPIYNELKNYMFLDFNNILDQPQNYDLVKMMISQKIVNTQQIQKKEMFQNKQSQDDDLFIKTQVNDFKEIVKKNLNKIQLIESDEYIQKVVIFLDFISKRHKIRAKIVATSFLMECYKKQIDFMVKKQQLENQIDFLEKIVGIELFGKQKEKFNYLNYIIDLSIIGQSIDVYDFNDWLTFIFLPNRVCQTEPLYKNILMMIQFLYCAITINIYYLQAVKKQFTTLAEQNKKLAGSATNYFFNIFDQKRKVIDFIKFKKTFFNSQAFMNFRIKVSRKNKRYIPSELLQVKKIKMFCFDSFPQEFEQYSQYIQKTISFCMLKIESIQIRNKLVRFAEKLPYQNLFQINLLRRDDENDKYIDQGIYCNLGYSTNLFSIPSIETIIREYNMHNKELKLDQKLIKPQKYQPINMVDKLEHEYKDVVTFYESQLVNSQKQIIPEIIINYKQILKMREYEQEKNFILLKSSLLKKMYQKRQIQYRLQCQNIIFFLFEKPFFSDDNIKIFDTNF